MRALERTQQGLQILLLALGVLGLSAVITLSGGVALVVESEGLGSRLLFLAQICLFLGLGVGTLGKLFCSLNPESSAQKALLQALPAEVLMWGAAVASVTFGWRALLLVMATLSYLMFVRFLLRFNSNIGGGHLQMKLIHTMASLGIGLTLSILAGIWDEGLSLVVLTIFYLVSVGFYANMIFSVHSSLPLYLEEVLAGITDPALSAEAREKQEKEDRLALTRSGVVDGDTPSGSMQPQGEPPEGARMYRIPKALEPLHLAVKEGNIDRAIALLKDGNDIHSTVGKGLSPLHIAASVGMLEVADLLVRAGAKVGQRADCGLTPLYFAAQTGNRNLVGYLVAKGARLKDRNEQGLTPLHWVCSVIHPRLTPSARLSVVECLLDLGASHRQESQDGETPKQLAKRHDLQYIVELFERRFPPLQKRIKSFQSTGEMSTLTANINPFLGAHLSELPDYLDPFLQAVKEGEAAKIETMLGDEANREQSIQGHRTAIHVAAISGVMSTAEQLLNAGFEVDSRCKYDITPLMLAIHRENLAMAGYLLAQGAELEAQDEMGRTAFHWAAAAPSERLTGCRRCNIVKFLREQGADSEARDKDGKTPLQLAEDTYEELVVALLKGGDEPEPIQDEDEYYV